MNLSYVGYMCIVENLKIWLYGACFGSPHLCSNIVSGYSHILIRMGIATCNVADQSVGEAIYPTVAPVTDLSRYAVCMLN